MQAVFAGMLLHLCVTVGGMSSRTVYTDPNIEIATTCDEVNGIDGSVYPVKSSVVSSTTTRYKYLSGLSAGRKEFECEFMEGCVWDGTTCSDGPCVGLAGAACAGTAECMLNRRDECVPKTCSKYTTEAACKVDTECGWKPGAGWAAGGMCTHTAFLNCPAVDLSLYIDGSGSMFTGFRYEPGMASAWWRQLLELKRWVRELPLTGDNHAAAKAGAGSPSGMRVGIVQFGKDRQSNNLNEAVVHTSEGDCAPGSHACTGGYLSGEAEELAGELEYMYDGNYMYTATYLGPALNDTADKISVAAGSGRKQVGIVITDGVLTDLSVEKVASNPWAEERLVYVRDTLGVDMHTMIVHSSTATEAFVTGLSSSNRHIVSDPVEDHMHVTPVSELRDVLFSRLCSDYIAPPPNECETVGDDVCNATTPRQECYDPSPLEEDWTCNCTVGTQVNGTGKRALAECALDECAEGNSGYEACVAIGQLCNDPEKTAASQDDFVCKCDPPLKGAVGTGEAAGPCMQNECADGDGKTLCVDAGQGCADTNRTHAGNFVCTCTRPGEYGNATGAAAVCALDECASGAAGDAMCIDHNQTCLDRNHTMDGDYVCTCRSPRMGDETGATALCELNECADGDGKTLCVDAGHTCTDTNRTHEGNFACTCNGTGETGSAVGRAPVCALNECDVGLALNATCVEANQTCVDPDDGNPADAYCRCQAPMDQQVKRGGAVERCEWDECADHGSKCTAVQQVCEDADNATMGTWVCKCVDPQVPKDAGRPVGNQTVADCKYKPGDCEAEAHVCTGTVPEQMCDPGVNPWDGRVLCQCPEPYTGDAGDHAHASCALDECNTTCTWCDKTGSNGNGTCAAAGQECVDEDHAAEKSWKCVCKSPYDGDAPKEAAACAIDECTETCDHCADRGGGSVCKAANQTCTDPPGDRTEYRNWYCECKAPQEGRGDAAAAVCELDECKTGGQAVCAAEGQKCNDPNKAPSSVPNDWTCTCAGGFNTSARAMAAVCEEDECADPRTAAVCEDADQTCVDTNYTTPGSWECRCGGNATGRAPGAVAECTVDECNATCTGCADSGSGNVCAAAGQTCYEPNAAVESREDWWCVCPRTGGMQARMAGVVPTCPAQNECRDATEKGAAVEGTHVPRYSAKGCLCDNNWKLSETYCMAHGLTCAGAGFDEPCPTGCCNPDGDAGGDWCMLAAHPYNSGKTGCGGSDDAWGYCVPLGVMPADGGVALPFPRNVSYPGVSDSESNVCADVGQTCQQGDPGVDGDWRCMCVAPLAGSEEKSPAECTRDECARHNDTCALAAPAGSQRCVDPNPAPAADGDWYCECVDGGEQAPRAAVGACPLDECEAGGEAVCAAVGQNCTDRNATTASTRDWYCECAAPTTGEKRTGAATCVLNECVGPCEKCAVTKAGEQNVCEAAGQVCEDNYPSPGSQGTWECVCDDFLTRATVAVAVCEVDECKGDGLLCGTADPPQDCVDGNRTQPDDWECVCNGTVGNAPLKWADCTFDECDTHRATCKAAGQACVDIDKNASALDTWYCRCQLPDETGADALKGVATCSKTGECVNNTACSDAGQVCYDDPDNLTATGNWECHCVGDYTGDAGQQGPATCKLDECAVVGGAAAVCALHGQDCVDTDDEADSTWECRCPGNATGTAGEQALATNCTLDECEVVCATCEGDVCGAAGQDCKDLDTAVESVKSWECRCRGDSPNVATLRVVPACNHDECKVHNATCEGASPEQKCVDPDPARDDNWECHCKPGMAAGLGVRAAAEGCDVFDECATECDHCADKGAGNVCEAAEQDCRDPEPWGEHENWECVCRGRATGANETAVVEECVLDECVTRCDSCAMGVDGTDVCAAVGQKCVEGTKTPYALEDWKCACAAPLEFVTSPMGVAKCEVDECEDAVDGAENPGAVCTAAGQNCIDTRRGTLGDFECVCPEPKTGREEAGPASCELDECAVEANADVCKGGATTPGVDALQKCHDSNWTEVGDWQCQCPLPSHGSAQAAAAACGVNECEDEGHREACAGAAGPAQRCDDGDYFAPGDWACVCMFGGARETAGPAVCELDECKAECATCEKGACTVAEQACDDPTRGVDETGDWVCSCYAPATGTGKGAAADECLYDECSEAGKCGDGQLCEDVQKGSRGNWECVCPLAPDVRATAGAAVCPVDECADAEVALVCQRAGQRCMDDGRADRLDNWECHCGALLGGAPGTMEPAACEQRGECADEATAAVCTDAGQACFDPNVTVDGNWVCLCVGGATGEATAGGPASCAFDECRASGRVCTAAEQRCVDVDPRVLSRENWACKCYAPQTGAAPLGPAVCAAGTPAPAGCVDECDDDTTCLFAEQRCVDPDPCVDESWECRCWEDESLRNKKAPVGSCEGAATPRPATPPPTATPDDEDRNDTDGATLNDDGCGSWWGCWWWLVLLLLVLCCCSCVLLVLLLRVRGRREAGEADEGKWNKMFVATLEEKDMGELAEGEEMSQSLLHSEYSSSPSSPLSAPHGSTRTCAVSAPDDGL